jgi:hypothetical protein
MYAAVDHGHAYEAAITGRHSDQLRLAYDEGRGKDDPPYDPFVLLLDEEDGGDDDVDVEEEGADAEEEAVGADALDEPLEDNGGSAEIVDVDEEEYDGEDGKNEEDEDNDESQGYTNQGFVDRPESQLVALKSGLPADGLFAVLQLPGTQKKDHRRRPCCQQAPPRAKP